eukprot:365551-Chlamydomonas_euryale.AAC.1
MKLSACSTVASFSRMLAASADASCSRPCSDARSNDSIRRYSSELASSCAIAMGSSSSTATIPAACTARRAVPPPLRAGGVAGRTRVCMRACRAVPCVSRYVCVCERVSAQRESVATGGAFLHVCNRSTSGAGAAARRRPLTCARR